MDELAKIHCDSLPGSLISSLGPNIVKRYYKFLIKSNEEHFFFIKEKEQITGHCVVSMAPDSLMKRFFIGDIFSIMGSVIKNVWFSRKNRLRIFSFTYQIAKPPPEIKGIPELVQICTSSLYRNKKIGTKLLLLAEEFLCFNKAKSYYIKTGSDRSNKALYFFEKKSFLPISKTTIAGKSYVYMIKQLQVKR